jgi:hypothetical protein
MAVDLGGLDPWPEVGIGGMAGEVLDGASVASAFVPGAGWVGMGLKILGGLMGGDTDNSQTGGQAQGQSQLNTSGWAVGGSSAQGADSQGGISQLAAIPWWGWAGFALVAVILIKKA